MRITVRPLPWLLSVLMVLQISLWGQSDPVRINEFMAINDQTLADGDGDFSDWIEIFNDGSVAVSLSGWALTDDPSIPAKWLIPDVVLGPQGYLVIFASGKDRAIAGSELHTSFKLSGSGEYLALTDAAGNAVTRFDPSYPAQQAGQSYGFINGIFVPFTVPTPGEVNFQEGAVLPSPVFSAGHGYYEGPFDLEISSEFPGADIWYTTDGTTPGIGSGSLYASPISIDSTIIVRAILEKDGQQPGQVATQSYIFLDDVIRQPNNPEGYPALWGPYTAISGTAIADYEMDPEMLDDPDFATTVIEGLKSLPVMSLVSDISNFFSFSTDPDSGGIYIHTGAPISRTEDGLGKGWERPASIEYFNGTGSGSFQVNCGVQLQGGHSRRPEKSPKHSFRLLFKSEYGASKLEFPLFGEEAETSFNSLILRAGFGNSWIHHSNDERVRAQYLRDIWSKDTQRAMGHPSSHSEYVHLFINGIYWGVYAPSERMDADFASSYMEGAPEEFDVIKDYQDVANGEIDAWNRTVTMANAGLADNDSYQLIQGKNPDGARNPLLEAMVDVTNLADYMLINFYGGNTDWDHHNWAVMRNRVNPGTGFKFLCWDEEHILKTVSENVLGENNDQCPSRIFQQLRENDQFLRLFADRVRLYCFGDGLLTPQSAAGRWMERMYQVEPAIPVESARWGDYRRDVHPYQAFGPFDLYTYEDYWLPQQAFMLNTYFPNRTAAFLNQLRASGLYPAADAPVFLINGEPIGVDDVVKGDMLSMTSPEGIIYYTTSGVDPANWDAEEAGSVPPAGDALLFSEPLPLERSSHILARTFLDGNWSALTGSFFTFPEDYRDIMITEIHYHPLDGDTADNSKFEFIELKNTGISTMELQGLSFVEGVDYTFRAGSVLTPGGFVVVASDEMNFFERYGFLPVGEYSGNLNNGGERIRLGNPDGDTVSMMLFDNNPPWPEMADGFGYSLVPVEFNPVGDQNGPQNWRASHQVGGSPGRDDTETTSREEHFASSPEYILGQNYPNPFSDLTHIQYVLPEPVYVELSVYNLVGQKLAVLESGVKNSGSHLVSWDGTDDSGEVVSEGVYFYRMVIRSHKGDQVFTRKMIRF